MGAMSRAMQGEKPGGIAGRQVTLTATIQAIDKKKQMVTLKGQYAKAAN
jgi:hypothetical protein